MCAGIFLGAASLLLKQEPRTRFIVPGADEQRKKEILEVLNRFPDVEDNTVLLDGKSDLAMEAADAILVASGTARPEAALYKKPLVVGYAMPALSAMLILSKGQTKWISLPNILAQKTLVPECVQMFCSRLRSFRPICFTPWSRSGRNISKKYFQKCMKHC